MVPVFAQVDSLPGSQSGFSPGDRYVQAAAEQAGFQVRGQVIRAFILMPVIFFSEESMD